ncbi:hypothetical protein BU23DRAFT_552659 [Bimuria novae-zelandiae CBS 107.79]|uniref:ATP-grasp domain-containing protein n=1 Tax=Bimuria novae-zelandiae CBS 107.79 TaxID=1447943 RepID=A0A6A5VJT8_9PLEO|nr:hypothetical protein BU23DRAFT_552659 [Bimuria novae-zelandiae CBS 107.79]
MAPQTPSVEADRTLYDLYSLDGGDPNEVAHVIALCPPNGSASSSLPESSKYTFQSPLLPKLDNEFIARIYLGNGSQNHAFAAGPIQLYLFDIDPPRADAQNGITERPPAAHTDAQRTFNSLILAQRPNLSFIPNPTGFKPKPRVKISPYPPLDFLDEHLTISTLSPADVLDEDVVKAEARRVFVMRTETIKAKRTKLFEIEVTHMLRRLTPRNKHLRHVSLPIQDYVEGDTKNQSMFITKSGRAGFICTVEQFLDEDGLYRASIIDYERQDRYKKEYSDIINKATSYCHSRGYWGPLGCDVMTDSAGRQRIVDLNVRITGDYFMGLLKGHFHERHGFNYSYLINLFAVLRNRDSFEKTFKKELMGKHEYSIGSVLIRGIDHEHCLELADSINAIVLPKPQQEQP